MSLPGFGVRKPVPVNLLMTAILIGGIAAGLTLRKEFFPESDPTEASITLPYPSASPEEIEQTLAIKVEDALADLEQIKTLSTNVAEGGGGIIAEFEEGANADDTLDDIQREIDSLIDLPDESERIRVRLLEPRLPVIRVSLFGNVDEAVMKQAIRGIKDDLAGLPGMGEILVEGVRDYEISVDVREAAMLEHGISLPQITDRIRSWMNDTPSGTVRTEQSNVKVRALGVQERALEIERIPLRSDPQGRTIMIGDVAKVRDGFVDSRIINRFNQQPAANLMVFKVGQQDVVKIAEMVRSYVAARKGEPFEMSLGERIMDFGPMRVLFGASHRKEAWELGANSPHPMPPSSSIDTTSDLARFVEGRLDLLTRNAIYGSLLVFATLLLFLNWRVAMWVGIGLVTAMSGTVLLMSTIDVTLNLLTMFGLIVVLGLLVDDAIVVAENIQARHDRGEKSLSAAVTGANEVAWPVVATVLTSIVAFIPLSFIRGRIGDLLGALPLVVACALMISLIESLLILPSHMGHSLSKRDKSKPGRIVRLTRKIEAFRDHIVLDRLVPAYGWVLHRALRFRYVSLSITIFALVISLGLIKGNYVTFTFLSKSDAETIIIELRMPVGTSIDHTADAVARIEQAASAQPETMSISSILGSSANLETGASNASADHVAQMFVELHPVERRDRESSQVIDSIRQALAGKMDDIERMGFEEISGGPGGPDISIEVRGEDIERMELAADKIKRELATHAGVYDIADDNDKGQLELQYRLKPGAAGLGLSSFDVARQIRGYLYGLEAHVFAANREDIDVRVRVEQASRRSIFFLNNSYLIGPAGQPVPLLEVVDLIEGASYANIKRVDRKRAITITASTAPDVSPETITPQLPIDELRSEYGDLSIDFVGRQEQMADAFRSLPLGFLAASIGIYIILAWLFSSYLQPIIVMLVIPFALIGAVWGHLILGYEMTFLSLIGLVALSGIVVNDSLILVKFYNRRREAGLTVFDALMDAGRARLRAILLTTITTVLGLTPLILEQSFQAKFLIPMAISIACGLIAATTLVLGVLPCMILIFDDIKSLLYVMWYGEPRHEPERDEPVSALPA